MSESAPEQGNPFTQQDITIAEQAEQLSLNANQKEYLTRRVVVLRAQVNKLQTALDEAMEALNALREQFADQLVEENGEQPGSDAVEEGTPEQD